MDYVCVCFNGGSDIYFYVWPQRDSESNEFEVRSIEGLGACPNIEEWIEDALVYATDLSPLGHLPRLRKACLNPEYVSSLDALTRLEKLEPLDTHAKVDPEVLAALKARGADIECPGADAVF